MMDLSDGSLNIVSLGQGIVRWGGKCLGGSDYLVPRLARRMMIDALSVILWKEHSN